MRESQIELAPDRLVRIDPETYRALAYPNCKVLAVKERISMSCPELSSYGANKMSPCGLNYWRDNSLRLRRAPVVNRRKQVGPGQIWELWCAWRAGDGEGPCWVGSVGGRPSKG